MFPKEESFFLHLRNITFACETGSGPLLSGLFLTRSNSMMVVALKSPPLFIYPHLDSSRTNWTLEGGEERGQIYFLFLKALFWPPLRGQDWHSLKRL